MRFFLIIYLNILLINKRASRRDNMKKEEIESVILASSHYLFEDLPNNFYKWPEKKIHKYCSDYAWQPFEFFEGSEFRKSTFEILIFDRKS